MCFRSIKGIGNANWDLPAGIPMKAKKKTGMPKIPSNAKRYQGCLNMPKNTKEAWKKDYSRRRYRKLKKSHIFKVDENTFDDNYFDAHSNLFLRMNFIYSERSSFTYSNHNF